MCSINFNVVITMRVCILIAIIIMLQHIHYTNSFLKQFRWWIFFLICTAHICVEFTMNEVGWDVKEWMFCFLALTSSTRKNKNTFILNFLIVKKLTLLLLEKKKHTYFLLCLTSTTNNQEVLVFSIYHSIIPYFMWLL